MFVMAASAAQSSPASEVTTPDTAGSEETTWVEKTVVDVEPSAESWTGIDGYRRVVSLYSGITWSPFTNLRQDGFRLRVVTDASLYRYSGKRYDAATDTSLLQNFTGTGRFLDLLAGWQFTVGQTTAKVFAGVGQTDHLIAPFDPETGIQGSARGFKGALELWHNWTPELWSSLDLSASKAHAMYSAQARLGWRVDQNWSAGPEVNVFGHSETTIERLGLFARFENLAHEFTISGGMSRARGDTPMGYGSVQYLRRF